MTSSLAKDLPSPAPASKNDIHLLHLARCGNHILGSVLFYKMSYIIHRDLIQTPKTGKNVYNMNLVRMGNIHSDLLTDSFE